MLLETIKQFNWVDIFVVIIILRICYASMTSGLPVEFFKFLGAIAAIYLSLHYYAALSDFLRQRLLSEKITLEFLDFLVFLALTISGYLIFVFLRNAFCRFVKVEAVSNLDRWGGLILGALRAILLVGLIIFMLVISSVSYLKNSVSASYLGRRFFRVAPATYSMLWDGFFSKFMTAEKFNSRILKVQEDFAKK